MSGTYTFGESSSSSGSRRRSSSNPGTTSTFSKHPPPFRSTAPPPGGAYHEPPSPRTTPTGPSTEVFSPSVPIPGQHTMLDSQPIAGPSSEGALGRRSNDESPSPTSPSSAPAVPSVIAVAHPSLYIHTQHPRRGSMTPLGLHVISPVPPNPNQPVRSVGFSPSYQPYAPSQHSPHQAIDPLDPTHGGRRGSTASNASTLTQSRPATAQHLAFPAGFNRERRRSSLTPTLPTLAPPSPTRAHVSGRIHSRPTSSDGSNPPPMHARTRTAENAPTTRPLLAGGSPLAGDQGRRGSLPHLGYGAWNGPSKAWNPSLPPPRGSLQEEGQLPDEGFRFGSGAPPTGVSAATTALKNLELSPGSRRNSLKKPADPFEETEAEEADRQQRAFLAATYGHDGKRARERLSFAGPAGMMGGLASPAMPGNNLRRQSLMLWEKINTAAAAARSLDAPATASEPSVSTLLSPRSMEELGPRRGSLPVAIPRSGLGRAPSRRRKDMDQPPAIIQQGGSTDDLEAEAEDSEDEPGLEDPDFNTLHAPQRPLPPLLPLSDPGPRLLPSTLALHRANHLLNSRNLQADPLPHPLPPSLHPPAPVDLAEFDIDFILAGSQAQLGGSRKSSNAPVDVNNPRPPPLPPTPTLRLGGDDEDTFAKFVGEFDDEYGGRRGEWTFRACPPRSPTATSTSSRQPKAEWDSSGAGRYELYPDGDVKSVQTGSVWKVRKSGSREYELEEKQHGQSEIAPFSDPSSSITGFNGTDCFVLTSKCAHAESGGISIPARYRSQSTFSFGPSEPQLRVSISDQLGPERTTRIGSADSASTARALSSSLPLVGVLTPKKNRQLSRGEQDASKDRALVPPPQFAERGRGSVSGASGRVLSADKRKEKRADSRERGGEEEKKKGGFGGAIKRAFKSTLAANDDKRAAREEKEREKMQSQSWSPSVAKPKDYIHPSGKGFAVKGPRNQVKTAPAALVERISRTPSDTSDVPRSAPSAWLNASTPSDRPRLSPRGSSSGNDAPLLREGKAWKGVPEEAVAMVVPLYENVTTPQTHTTAGSGTDASRQALLVWYVPFNSDIEERPPTAASSSSSRQGSEPVGLTSPTKTAEPSSVGSLPKFQKLLRRRASKDKDALKREQREMHERLTGSAQSSTTHLSASMEHKLSCALHPMPFRSFRVVARVVDTDELRSDNASHGPPSFSPFNTSRATSGRAPSSLGSNHSPSYNARSLPSTDENEASSLSTAPTSTILAGRTFPTVIAVCHSRSQGVEFVLEGLDRLGFCQGESAWGPTGYEEWRGSGLSERGRELLDLLWAGCVGVMGLLGPT